MSSAAFAASPLHLDAISTKSVYFLQRFDYTEIGINKHTQAFQHNPAFESRAPWAGTKLCRTYLKIV